jgi:hypothetical protein
MAQPVATILSYGLGVESSAILLRWIMSPVTRPCSLEDLIVITSQVGDEYTDTGRDVEAHILPLMRAHGIRYVQVARHGHFEGEGITVLDDSRTPARVFLEGDYKLSDELKRNGTVPQYGGVHRCALKFKAWVIEQWLEENVRGRARHAIGYNADETARVARSEYAFGERIAFGFNVDETSRINRSCEYNTLIREAFYPLLEWRWDRRTCIEYIRAVLGITWKKSACVYCPFNKLRDDAIERQREHPRQVGDAMRMEHLSLALNPRGTIYKGRSLIQITIDAGNDVAVELYRKSIGSEAWALYRVRRIYSGKGKADRAVEKLRVFEGPAEARMALNMISASSGVAVEKLRGIPYVWHERRSETDFPTREEFITIAPAAVETKARYGLDWFEGRWSALLHLF